MQRDLDRAAEEVAGAVQLREGKDGVWAVLSTIARFAPVPVREVSRRTGLPVPIVAAICGELRGHGLLDGTRPARLSEAAAAEPALAALRAVPVALDPEQLDAITSELTSIAASAPSVDVAIDQSHCTVETKLRRARYLLEETAAARGRLLLLGDDDLTSVAVSIMARRFEIPLAPLTVLDVDGRVLELIHEHVADADCRVHDLREPLPDDLRGAFDVVLTDPPYTVEGGRLFVARGASALRPRAGAELLLCFGPKDHADSLELYRRIAELGLYPRALVRNFNEYLGAGVLGGVSHLHHLVTGGAAGVAGVGAFDGPIYTGEARVAAREYECTECGAVRRVGRGSRWSTVAELKAAGCDGGCRSTSFRPRARVR